jgi:hypothetical protein
MPHLLAEIGPAQWLAYFSLHRLLHRRIALTLGWSWRPTKPQTLRCNPTTGNIFRQ